MDDASVWGIYLYLGGIRTSQLFFADQCRFTPPEATAPAFKQILKRKSAAAGLLMLLALLS